MKVTIKEWNAVASWRWDMPEDDVCGICRVQFDGTCPTCKYPGDDCTLCELYFHLPARVHSGLRTSYIVIGKCGHSFHMVRISSSTEALKDDAEISTALPPYLDPARFVQRTLSDVQTKYGWTIHYAYDE